LGLYERSVEAYEYAVAINENYDLAYRECGDAYFKLKQYHKAIEHYKRAIEISKPYEELNFAIGLCYEKLKDYPKARMYYRKAINNDPKFHQAFYRIGITYKKDKHWENAAHFYRKALQLDNNKISYLISLAEAASKLNDEVMLRQTIMHIFSVNPQSRSRRIFKQLTEYALRAKCFDLSLDIISLARIENKEFDHMIYFEAIATYLAGMHNEAIVLFEHALHLDAKHFKIVFKFIPDITQDQSVMYLLDLYKK
jgi:tetratricopeptide (TPR) repeat protein